MARHAVPAPDVVWTCPLDGTTVAIRGDFIRAAFPIFDILGWGEPGPWIWRYVPREWLDQVEESVEHHEQIHLSAVA